MSLDAAATEHGVQINGDTVFGDGRLGLIAGPCVIESADHCLRMASAAAGLARSRHMPFVFKTSFDKANRTSKDSSRGPGLHEGLEVLQRVRRETGVAVLTDVHETSQIELVAEVVDVLQIPAFLCRQTDLVTKAAASGRVVNLKKGQFLAPWDMRHVVEKATAGGNRRLLVTERGTCFGYNNLVVDLKSLVILAQLGFPVVLDGTHSLQRPGGDGGQSGGEPEFTEALAAAGVAVGIDALFLEVHDEPRRAASDAATQLPLQQLGPLLDRALRVHDALRGVTEQASNSRH